MENLTLTDTAISHIAKLIQVAILTGTDIVDNLRMAQFVSKEGQLDIAPEYHELFNENIQRMMEEATSAAEQPPEEPQQEWATVDVPKEAVTIVNFDPNEEK